MNESRIDTGLFEALIEKRISGIASKHLPDTSLELRVEARNGEVEISVTDKLPLEQVNAKKIAGYVDVLTEALSAYETGRANVKRTVTVCFGEGSYRESFSFSYMVPQKHATLPQVPKKPAEHVRMSQIPFHRPSGYERGVATKADNLRPYF